MCVYIYIYIYTYIHNMYKHMLLMCVSTRTLEVRLQLDTYNASKDKAKQGFVSL